MYMAWLPCMWVVVLPFMGFLFSGWEKKHSSCHHAAISSTNLRKPTSVTYIWKHLQRTSTGCGVFGKVARLRPFSSFKRPRNQPDTCYRGLAWTDRYRCWVQIQRFQKEEMLETPKDSWLEGENDPFSGSMLGFPEVVGIWVERSSTCWDLNLSFWNTFFPEGNHTIQVNKVNNKKSWCNNLCSTEMAFVGSLRFEVARIRRVQFLEMELEATQRFGGGCWFSAHGAVPWDVLGMDLMNWALSKWLPWLCKYKNIYVYIYIFMIHVDFVAVMHIQSMSMYNSMSDPHHALPNYVRILSHSASEVRVLRRSHQGCLPNFMKFTSWNRQGIVQAQPFERENTSVPMLKTSWWVANNP